MTYLLPTTVDSALEALARGKPTIVAGATDYYPALKSDADRDDIVDITGLDDLRGITHSDGQWRVGALTTWTDVARANLPAAFAGLQAAATQVGGVQIQNVASVAGNLCNASPAADGAPPLLSLDARIELTSTNGTRVLGLEEFILGNRSTARRPDELVTAIVVPDPPETAVGSFEKLGARAYLVISIVMVALRETRGPRILGHIDRDGGSARRDRLRRRHPIRADSRGCMLAGGATAEQPRTPTGRRIDR